MKAASLFAAAAASLVLTAAPAIAQTQSVQTGAGKLDAEGWTDAASVQGAYSVRFPCLFDEKLNPGKPEGPAAKSFTMDCTREDGTLFRAMRVEFVGGPEVAQRLYDQIIGMGDNKILRRFTFNGGDAIDLKNEAGDHCAWTRMIRAGGDDVLLIVEHSYGQCATLQPDVTKFFDSIVVKPR